jgi:hypothetical protein
VDRRIAQPIDQPVKPGYATTEFWLSFAPAIFAILTIVHPGFDASTYQPLANAIATIAAALASGWYAHSRSQVKSAVSGAKGAEAAAEAAVRGPTG